MSKWCRLHTDGCVLEMFDTDPVAYLHPSLYEQTKSCPDTINPGDYFYNGEWYPRPGFATEFSTELPGWVIDKVAEIEHAKQNKIVAIDVRTAELIQYGFEFETAIFSMSDNAQKNWNALATGLALKKLPFPYPISTKDEAIFILTSEAHLNSFLDAYLLYQADPSKPLGSGRTLKARVNAATTLEELEAIADDRA